MRLLELQPRWVEKDGQKVGLLYWCPHCRNVRLFTTLLKIPRKQQSDLVAHYEGEDNVHVTVHSSPECAWAVTGELNFETLTLHPSVDASASGHWHGFITDGKIIGGV